MPPPAAPGPTDTVPAMLTPGEYVLKRDAVRRIGVDKLNQLNQGYQDGGKVTPAEGAALQTAGQYAGTRDVLTPENAQSYGLDPSKGFINPNFGVSQSATPQPPAGVLAGVAGTQGGAARADPNPLFKSSRQVAQVAQGQHVWSPADIGAVPDSEHSNAALAAGAIPDSEHQKTAPAEQSAQKPVPNAALEAGAIPDSEHGEQKPAETQQPEQPKTDAQPQIQPAPKTGPASIEGSQQTPSTDQDERAVKIKALVQGGKTPGEAQAIVDGQPPKTVTGETPPPTEQKPAAVTLPTSNNDYVAPKDAHDVMGINRNVWQNVMSEEGKEFGLDPGTKHMSVFGLWEGTPDAEGDAYNAVKAHGNTSLEAYNAVTTAWTKKFLGQSQPWKLTSPGMQEMVIADSQHRGGGAALKIINDMGGWDQINKMDPKDAIAQYSKLRLPLWPGNAGRVAREGAWALRYDRTIATGAPPDMTADISKLPGIAGGGGGDKGATGKGATGKGEVTLVPMAGSAAGSPAPAQAEAPLGARGGGASIGGRPPEAPTSADGSFGGSLFPSFGGIAAGALLGSLFGGGGRPQATEPSEEPGPSPSAVMTKVLAAGGPPPAPGAEPVDLSTMKPANVLGVRTLGAPSLSLPAPPAAPSAAPTAAPDPIVIKGLMKQGFTREQALAFAAKATVSKPGAAALAGGASFRAPAQLPAPPAAPSRQPPAAAKPQPQAPPTKPQAQPPPAKPQAPPRPAQQGIAPRGSTVGIPNPPGGPSPDDPRVKKQKDNLTKGEHFVPGDDFHDQLLNGLPNGHGGRQRQILAQAEQAIAEKRPMHISYISAPEEAQKFPTRESRTIQYEAHSPEARLMGTTEGQLVGHSMIPVAVGVSPSRKAGEPHQGYIQGLSTNVIANNFAHLNTKLAAMGRKTPYARFGPKFANDLEGYLHNLNAGHTGTGRGYALGTAEYPNEPDTSHVPYKLTRHETDFLNAVINNTGAFAKHEDAQALRELARVNGTLITPAGETNRLLHEIEQHDPGWSGRGSGQRGRVLEPSIRSFKTGLIHEVHPSEEHLPATIRPGQEYRDLTAAMQRTSERGRPDVPVAVSLHHTFADNKAINQIEREFSEERISEADARARLHALGEDPDQYRFVGGSGGLITPYEENPEAITPEEHTTLKDNLRKQWIGGKMPIEDYRRKTAEVPLPEIPSRPTSALTAASPTEEKPTPSGESVTAPKPKPPKPAAPPEQPKPEETEPAEESATASSPKPPKQRGFKAYKEAPLTAPSAPAKAPEAAAPEATETLYRGTTGTGEGGHFYSPDKEFARQFTQSGRDSEIKSKAFKSSEIHEPKEEVFAGDPDSVDKAVAEAKTLGKTAVRLSEGKDQPKSVFHFKPSPEKEPEAETPTEAPATPPAPGEPLPAKKPKKPAKTKEEKAAEAEDLRQAAIDRNDIPEKDTKQLNRLQRVAKGWIKQNPELHPLSAHAYLTGQKEFPNQGELNKVDIGTHFDADNPKLDFEKDEHRQHAANGIVHDIMHALAGTKTGKPSSAWGWYDRAVRKTLAKISQIAPKILTDPEHAMAFKLGTAITSQGQDVFPNAVSGWDVYRHWRKHGELPTDAKVFGGGPKADAMVANFTKVNALWKTLGTEGLQKLLTTKKTVRQLRDEYGLKIDEPLNTKVYGAMALGPKIGAFFSNLNGNFDPTTIDMWFSRTMNRLAGNMFGFSDTALRENRLEKGKVVKSHINEFNDLLKGGQLTGVDKARAQKMQAEVAALQAHPKGQLDRAKALELAPEIHNWARERHEEYSKSEGYERSYHPELKTPENLVAKKLDNGIRELSDAPRTISESRHWHDIMARVDTQLRDAGIKLTNADKQALLWFVEKDLFRLAGSNSKVNADYLDAAYRLVRKVKSGQLPGLEESGVLHMNKGGVVPGLSGVLHMDNGGTVPTMDARLADLRARYAAEFQNNPDLARKFLASMTAEVGDLSPDFQQGYVEAVMNRAARRDQTLDYALSEDHSQWYGTGAKRHRGYYAPETIAQLGKFFKPSELASFQPLIDNALNGSNKSNYATGNESDEMNSGPTTLAAGDKHNNRLIIEQGEQEWANGMTSRPPKAVPVPQQPFWAAGTPLASGPDIVRPPSTQAPKAQPVNQSAQTDSAAAAPAYDEYED